MANPRFGRLMVCSALFIGLATASVTVSGYFTETSPTYAHAWHDLAFAPAMHAEIITIAEQPVVPPVVCLDMTTEANTPDVVARCRSPGA